MLTIFEVLLVFALIISVLVVVKNQQVKESTNHIAKRFCQQNQLQFLDGTVALGSMRFTKSSFPSLLRQYRFEYSINKIDRYWGSVSMIGRQTHNVYVDPDHLPPSDPANPSSNNLH